MVLVLNFKFNNLGQDEIKCAEIIGVNENFITKKRFQSTKTVTKSHFEITVFLLTYLLIL